MNDPAPEVAPARRSMKLPLLAAVVAIVVVGGLWLGFRHPRDLVQGMADADTIKVSAKITARVSKLLVREGDDVVAGEVLFELDSPEVQAKVRQVNAMLDVAKAQASKASEGTRREDILAAAANWKRAVAAADLAHVTYRRVENLYGEGVVTLQKRDEAMAQMRGADEAVAAARAQYDLALTGTRNQDKLAAEAQVQQAEGGLAEVEAARAEIRGAAPSAGQVNKRLADIGELVPAGYPVFTLIDLDKLWVAFFLREDQFAGVRMKQRLHGSIPALGIDDAEFEVYFINPAGDFATWRATRQ